MDNQSTFADNRTVHAAELPSPTRERWQTLRAGLVDLFHYDVEEFWFHEGRVIFRGNNGAGKSKVLSFLCPLLFDCSLNPTRVEPDGDRTKKMEWNLLMGGRYERRSATRGWSLDGSTTTYPRT